MGESSIMKRNTGNGSTGPDAEIQLHLKGKGVLEQFLRHLESIEIDLSESELTLESCLPAESLALASVERNLTRTFDLDDERYATLREAVDYLVDACQEAMAMPDVEYEPDRCDRCVKSDCCSIERIHVSEEERVRILAFIGEPDTPESYHKYFEEDDDVGGFYKTILRHTKGSCCFLKPMANGLLGCSIYPARPQVCRDFDAAYCDEYTELLPKGQCKGPKS